MSEPVREASAIRAALNGELDVCSYCARPIASETDWKEYPEGGGEHLCWDGGDAGCTDAGAVTLRREDVLALLADRDRLAGVMAAAEKLEDLYWQEESCRNPIEAPLYSEWVGAWFALRLALTSARAAALSDSKEEE